ncbi:glycosyl transferase family 1 [Paraburkholderia ginsengiterrae]|uniref:Glycosyl transferase family 1 n=1 Tax=Paraburkholderia ginsengiterrae TaxID=1462993 RepID=A0A1A9N707_9BURK|nr:glycosyltransferase family 4 protein [Paraburkholderia ginsengiterrae]OAJ51879.1 glycosyl transferase family 1 [Paraburkholderia ginsengiterrae]OAJ59988.1 glycosyl transferase family 1 [Paraburkholderia ginsengiterrae]
MSDPIRRPVTDIALTAQALKNSGGAERYTRDVIAGLHRMGLRPTLFAREIDRALPEAAWIDAQPLNVRWAPRKLRNLAFDWRLKQRLKRHRPACVFSINHSTHADVALCGGTHPGSLEAAGRAVRRSDQWQIDLERRVYTQARSIVAHSQLMSRELQRFYGVPAARIDVLYPPVDTTRFRPLDDEARAAARRKFELPEDRVIFMFSSTSHERKGYPLLEAFFAQTTLPVCLVVAGRPVPKTSDTIRYVGYCKEIETLFAAADFTVVASAYEPFGLVGVESVMCGTPLVIADNVGSAETVTGEAKIEFSRQSAGSFERAIHTAVERVRGDGARIAAPLDSLVYDPGVDAHVAALYALFTR